ncbi:hypothetical protein LCGC14_1510800 [marine sediment metagenome]|uniref:Uncharacterized protein n=1 Tax=marine sediment metagenome TaxID=412755 RepID=A0A0F9J1H1_9ZZZZ
MTHTVLIWSKSQSGFTKIETRIEVNEEHIEQLALQMFDSNHYRDEGKSLWAEIDETTH